MTNTAVTNCAPDRQLGQYDLGDIQSGAGHSPSMVQSRLVTLRDCIEVNTASDLRHGRSLRESYATKLNWPGPVKPVKLCHASDACDSRRKDGKPTESRSHGHRVQDGSQTDAATVCEARS